MGVNDQGIVYNIDTRHLGKDTQDLMFCVPCALRVTHAMVMDLVKLSDQEETFNDSGFEHAPIGKAESLRLFAEAYQELSDKMNEWADIHDEVAGVTKNALRKQTKTV